MYNYVPLNEFAWIRTQGIKCLIAWYIDINMNRSKVENALKECKINFNFCPETKYPILGQELPAECWLHSLVLYICVTFKMRDLNRIQSINMYVETLIRMGSKLENALRKYFKKFKLFIFSSCDSQFWTSTCPWPFILCTVVHFLIGLRVIEPRA